MFDKQVPVWFNLSIGDRMRGALMYLFGSMEEIGTLLIETGAQSLVENGWMIVPSDFGIEHDAVDEDDECGQQFDRFHCTRAHGHSWDHVMFQGGNVVARWSQDGTPLWSILWRAECE
jgi:hypothetical protein